MKEFGAWLFERRRAAEMNQEELARRAGCSKSYISGLERGIQTITGDKLVRPSEELVEHFAVALGVPVDEARLAAGYAAHGDEGTDPTFVFRLKRMEEGIPAHRRAAWRRSVQRHAETSAELLCAS